uniref:Uncharacterized protein n=1 Tax=Triticum urartu TaxID=4572 RepID=A0A8R7U8M3_TRIUA
MQGPLVVLDLSQIGRSKLFSSASVMCLMPFGPYGRVNIINGLPQSSGTTKVSSYLIQNAYTHDYDGDTIRTCHQQD